MAKQDRRIKEGRGQGSGSSYKPYNATQDLRFRSNKTRVKGWTTGRVHHLATDLHKFYFYLLDYAQCVADIQEEYPLSIDDTMAIAQRYDLKHPMEDGKPKVITTDFRVTVRRGRAEPVYARAIRTSSALSARKGQTQLEIQRIYFQALSIDWGIVTEIDFPKVVANNIQGIHPFRDADGFVTIPQHQFDYAAGVLTSEVQSKHEPLSAIANSLDQRLGFQPGSCIALARHLIATRKWLIDMYQPFSPVEPLNLVSVDKGLLR